jgi:hypothetical protein
MTDTIALFAYLGRVYTSGLYEYNHDISLMCDTYLGSASETCYWQLSKMLACDGSVDTFVRLSPVVHHQQWY